MKTHPKEKVSEWIRDKGVPLTFGRGQILFYQGHQPFGGFLIERGRVGLKSATRRGRERFVATQSEGGVVGLEEILDHRPYLSTAVSLTESRVYFISRPQIEKWVTEKNVFFSS